MANTVFSGDTGYRGVVMLGQDKRASQNETIHAKPSENTNMNILLATSGQFSQSHNAIFSSGDWGAGYMNISEQVAYANNIIRVEGSIGLEVTADINSSGSTIQNGNFKAMKNYALINRGAQYGTSILLYPNGVVGFRGASWCTSLSFSMSQDAILTADMNWSSYIDGVSNIITTNDDTTAAAINTKYGASGNADDSASSGLPFAFNALYPYWGSTVYTQSSGSNTWTRVDDIMSWSAAYDSSIEMLKCCGTVNANGSALMSSGANVNSAPVAPDYLGLGPMNANCSFEIFKLGGDFNYNKFHAEKGAKFKVTTPAGNDPHTILIPKIVCNSNSSQVQTGNGWITASFQYQAVGDAKGAPMDIDRAAQQE